MKKHLISAVAILAVLVMTWAAFGQQDQDERRQRRARMREAQGAAIEAIQDQAAKIKSSFEESARARGDRSSWQDLSEDERAERRERFMKMREEQQKAIEVIEQQIVLLKGPRQLRTEHEASIEQLQAIQALAVKEQAKETAKHVEEMIAKRNKEFEEMMEKLGFGDFGQRP